MNLVLMQRIMLQHMFCQENLQLIQEHLPERDTSSDIGQQQQMEMNMILIHLLTET